MIGLNMYWMRCPDGAELVTPNPAPKRKSDDKRTVLNIEDDRPYIKYRTDRLEPVYWQLKSPHEGKGHLGQAKVVDFIGCKTDQHFVAFIGKNGLPINPRKGNDRAHLYWLKGWRDGLEELLTAASSDDPAKALKIFEKINTDPANLQPRMYISAETGKLTGELVPESPMGFMIMECYLAILNSTSLLTCRQCGSFFLAGAGTNKRTNAFYCSNRCRVAAQAPAKQKPKTTA